MLATLANAPLVDPRLVYERKYDGIRAVIEVASAKVAPAGGKTARVRIASRLGNDKTAQFPEVVASLVAWARANPAAIAGGPLILDGEIVALDDSGAPLGFQRIQDRIHLTGSADVVRVAARHPVAYVVFDLLFRVGRDLRALPLAERRMQLEQLFADARPERLRLSEIAVGDGTAIYQQALADGWEGLIAKDGASRYRSGERASEWRKIKLVKRQEMIVGGWTEPRRSRAKLGALLLGVREPAGLRYAGHVGSGFTEKDLERIGKKLAEREVEDCPFTAKPPANERPHWVRPELVAEVQFSGWTDDGIARHAVFLGLRDDVVPEAAVREDVPPDEQEPMAPRRSQQASRAGRVPSSRSSSSAPSRSSSHPRPAAGASSCRTASRSKSAT